MDQTPQQIRYKPFHSPSMFNKEMAIGTMLGLSVPIPGVNVLTALGIAGGAGLIGGLIGKNRMKKEEVEGKLVSNNPSGWNNDGGTWFGFAKFGFMFYVTARAWSPASFTQQIVTQNTHQKQTLKTRC